MDDLFIRDDASTPLTEDEKAGLRLSHITFRHELNAAEQQNIMAAEAWLLSARRETVLSEKFLRALHKKMFGQVWRWAGQYRQTERNIGVAPHAILEQLQILLGNTPYWITHETYLPDEIAVRFHHCLVYIHPFPNGNGRFSRLASDLLLQQLGQERFSWGRTFATDEGRSRYIEALRQADRGKIEALLEFARQ